jgi:hypothetical protein
VVFIFDLVLSVCTVLALMGIKEENMDGKQALQQEPEDD